MQVLTPTDHIEIDNTLKGCANDSATKQMVEWALDHGNTESGLLKPWARHRIDVLTKDALEIFATLQPAERNYGRYRGAIIRLESLRRHHNLDVV